MSYIASGYISIRVLSLLKVGYKKFILAILFSLVFASVLYYPKISTESYYGKLKTYHGLNGETWLKERYPELFAVVWYFRKNVTGQPVILEAPGDSYTEYNVVSSYTGLPTVSGWFVHEWLWRGDSILPQERVADITVIYTSEDLDSTRVLISRYNVDYIIIGSMELEKFPNLYEEKFDQLGKIVFSSGSTKVYKIN